MAEENPIMRLLTLLIPITFIFGGIWCEILLIRGKSQGVMHANKETMTPEQYKRYRKNELIIGSIVSIGMVIFGGWLLYHWLFGPTER